jgi:hypothetical protein
MLFNLPDAMAVQIWSLNSIWSEKYCNLIYFEKNVVSVWVPNSEETK